MEENKIPVTPNAQPGTGQVMDIQPPRNSATAGSVVAAAPVAPSPHVEEEMTTPTLAAEPADDVPAAQPAVEENQSVEAVDRESSRLASGAPNPLAIPELPAPKKDRRVLLVTAALAVSLTLAGVSVFVYLQTNKSPLNPQPMSGAADQEAAVPAAATEVDGAMAEIDKSIGGTQDDTDFAENDLSDSTLGL